MVRRIPPVDIARRLTNAISRMLIRNQQFASPRIRTGAWPGQASLPDGVTIHRVPSLHAEDVVTLSCGLRVTSVSRTLIDLAEVLTREELREAFAAAGRPR